MFYTDYRIRGILVSASKIERGLPVSGHRRSVNFVHVSVFNRELCGTIGDHRPGIPDIPWKHTGRLRMGINPVSTPEIFFAENIIRNAKQHVYTARK
jgi:hypothetical protein